MDHLPPVVNAHRAIEVVYHGYHYEENGFTDFPVPEGVSIVALQDPTTSLEDVQHAAPYLQARFFFGIMREVLNVPIDISDFIKIDKGRRLITTAALSNYLRSWKVTYEDLTEAEAETANARTIKCLSDSYDSWRAIPRFTDILQPEVELCIQLVACALEHAMSCVADIAVGDLPWRQARSEFVFSRMVSDGWCPSLVWQIGSSKLTWQYFVSLLGPPQPRKDHGGCLKEGSCLVEQQRASDEDNASQHVCGATCPSIAPHDKAAIATIVKAGGIPLLEYRDGRLYVTPNQKTVQYTAISHVWTDGLGNTEQNSMPRCQLERLNESMRMIHWTNKCWEESLINDNVWLSKDKVIELTPDHVTAKEARPLLFWIDTICVPRDPDLKRMAINNMRAIYNRANRVLVFDAAWARVNGRISSEEILTRVSLSNWIRRFWTLQEAILGKVLWYRFGDECYRQLSDGIGIKAATWLNEVQYYCEHFDFNWRHRTVETENRKAISQAQRVTLVWNELSQRTSSFKEDQPICIATLLDMDIDSIQQPTGYDARFRKLWLEYEALPKRILFLPGPRLAECPLRWAPASLHGLDMMPIPPAADEEAKPTAQGLELRHHGILSTSRVPNSEHGFIPMQIGDEVYLVRENTKRFNPSWKGLDFTAFDCLAVLLAQNEMHTEAERKPFDWTLGALLGVRSPDVSEQGATVIECEYLRTVSVLRRGSSFEAAYRRRSPLSVEPKQEDAMIVAASWSTVGQLWLIT